jgi:hypothetical protein
MYHHFGPEVVGVFTRDFRQRMGTCRVLVTVPQCLEIMTLSLANREWVSPTRSLWSVYLEDLSVHTHAHAWTHRHIHVNKHAHKYVNANAYTHTHTCTLHTCLHKYTHAYTHARKHLLLHHSPHLQHFLSLSSCLWLSIDFSLTDTYLPTSSRMPLQWSPPPSSFLIPPCLRLATRTNTQHTLHCCTCVLSLLLRSRAYPTWCLTRCTVWTVRGAAEHYE